MRLECGTANGVWFALQCSEEAQLLNYLNATGFSVGLLINFGSTGKLEWKRMTFTKR